MIVSFNKFPLHSTQKMYKGHDPHILARCGTFHGEMASLEFAIPEITRMRSVVRRHS